jgi:hypothetical protein
MVTELNKKKIMDISAGQADPRDIVRSPTGRYYAYALRVEDGWAVVRSTYNPKKDEYTNPLVSSVYRSVTGVCFNPVQVIESVVFVAERNDGRQVMVYDFIEGDQFDFVGSPIFSSSGHVTYKTKNKDDIRYIVSGGRVTKLSEFISIRGMHYASNSDVFVYKGVLRDHSMVVVSDGAKSRHRYVNVGDIYCSPMGVLVYSAKKYDHSTVINCGDEEVSDWQVIHKMWMSRAGVHALVQRNRKDPHIYEILITR